MANNGYLSRGIGPSKVDQGDRKVTVRFGVNETRWESSVYWDLNRELILDLGNKTIRIASGCAQACSASCSGGCGSGCGSGCTGACYTNCAGSCDHGCSGCSGPGGGS